MTSTLIRIVLMAPIIVLSCQGLAAQNPREPARTNKSAPARSSPPGKDYDQEQNAVNTLLYLRSSAGEIESPRDRVRVLLEVADALWLVNKELAADVFKQSFTQAVAADGAAKDDRTARPSKDLQQVVITRTARRDPELARSLLTSTVEAERSQGTNPFGELYGMNGSSGEMLVKAAGDALTNDPNQAVEIARTASADGLSQQMRLFLLRLRARDRAASDALFEDLLQNAANRRPKQLVEALFLWDYAFQRKIIYLGSVAWFRESPTEYPISPDLKLKGLAFAVDAIVENAQQFYLGNATEADKPLALERYALLYSVATQILPDVKVLMPSAAPTVLAQMTRLEEELRQQGQKPPEPPEPLPASGDTSDIDKLIERAAKAPNSTVKDAMYARAAYRLYLREEYERALDTAGNIDNVDLRLKVTEPIRFDWAGNLINQHKPDAALNVVRGIQTLELRAAILVHLANAFLAEKKDTQAVAVLSEAEGAAAKAKPSLYLASAVLGIAQMYIALNNETQAEQSTSTAIRLINTSEESSSWDLLVRSKASGRLSVTDSEWVSKRGEGVSIRAVYPRIAGLLDVLSKISEASLDEALTLAREIKTKGLNYAAQAALCRQVVERIHAKNGAATKTNARLEEIP